MSTKNKELAEKLSVAREKLGLTQAEVAERLEAVKKSLQNKENK